MAHPVDHSGSTPACWPSSGPLHSLSSFLFLTRVLLKLLALPEGLSRGHKRTWNSVASHTLPGLPGGSFSATLHTRRAGRPPRYFHQPSPCDLHQASAVQVAPLKHWPGWLVPLCHIRPGNHVSPAQLGTFSILKDVGFFSLTKMAFSFQHKIANTCSYL